MFQTLIVQPIFNILSFIYAVIPGHDFGVAIILFTVLARWALFPMLKKQLKNTKAMRELQPELKKIKEATKGNKQQETMMMMELYREKEIKPLSQIGLLVFQTVVFLALFSGLRQVVNNPQNIVDLSYGPVQSLSWMKEVASDSSKFDETLFGNVDLTRAAVTNDQALYWPAFVMVLGSAILQFLQIKQTMPNTTQSRRLRDILKDSKEEGKEADASEVNAAVGRSVAYVMPALLFFLTIGFPAALALYWFVSGLVAYLQQSYLLKQDEFMMAEASAVVVRKKSLREESKKPNTKTVKKASVKKKKR